MENPSHYPFITIVCVCPFLRGWGQERSRPFTESEINHPRREVLFRDAMGQHKIAFESLCIVRRLDLCDVMRDNVIVNTMNMSFGAIVVGDETS